jgi:ribosomal protein S18 acetylase RimI-like enzyme
MSVKLIENPTEGDILYVNSLTRDSFTGVEVPPESHLRNAVKSGRLFLSIPQDSQPVGYAIVTERYDAPWLFSMAVDPYARKCGYGQGLLKAVTNDAYDRGHRMVGLTVKQDNIGAQIMYLKAGFIVELVMYNYYIDADGLLMRKRWK